MFLGIIAIEPARAGFVDVTPPELALGGTKEAGAAFFDQDGDGDWDLVTAGTAGEARLLRNDGAGLADWTDVTADRAPALLDGAVARALLVGDLTHDGWPDLVRVSFGQVDVLIGGGPPSHVLTTGFVYELPQDGVTVGFDGAALLDADGDGWLDVLVSAAYLGNFLLTNPGDGTADFTVADQAPLGMTLSATNSDAVAVADWDGDGDPDVVVRGEGYGPDAFLRVPGGWDPLDLDIDAHDEGKGGVAFCDARNTGALDLLWTSPFDPKLRNYEWDGARWDPLPADDALNGVRSVACGDVDNDGNLDLWIADRYYDHVLWGPDQGHGHVNEGDGVTSVATALADVDGDGDLDAYQVRETTQNTLLENDQNDDRWLQVTLLAQVAACPSAPVHRADLGGWARAFEADGTPVSSRTELSGGFGRGQVAWPVLHLGGVEPDHDHRLEVGFAYGGDPTPVVLRVPAGVHEVVVASDDPDGDGLRTSFEAVDGRGDSDGDGLMDWADDDADGDGFGDAEESSTGDPCEAPIDTDEDGLPDAVDLDSDDDGLDDPDDPGRADADLDDDGLSDGAEVLVHGTDPLRYDTDGDGLGDGDEVARGSDPLDAEDPAGEPDRDGDGVPDAEEVARGSDPLNPDSDGDGALDGADPDPLDPGGVRGGSPPPEPRGCASAPVPTGWGLLLVAGVALRWVSRRGGCEAGGRRPRQRPRPAGSSLASALASAPARLALSVGSGSRTVAGPSHIDPTPATRSSADEPGRATRAHGDAAAADASHDARVAQGAG